MLFPMTNVCSFTLILSEVCAQYHHHYHHQAPYTYDFVHLYDGKLFSNLTQYCRRLCKLTGGIMSNCAVRISKGADLIPERPVPGS
jgi:hypothetical protein